MLAQVNKAEWTLLLCEVNIEKVEIKPSLDKSSDDGDRVDKVLCKISGNQN
jgi:hypothetical protein